MASTKQTEKKEMKEKKTISFEAPVYSEKAKKVGTFALPKSVFGVKWNADLVHQVIVSMMSNARAGTAHTKDRSEVSGGGKKPWKQKGTGRARHGSSRSPIWVGGGVAHGPRTEKDYSKKINKKMRVKALFTVLSKKFALGKVLFVDSLSFTEKKTKTALETLLTLATIEGFEKLGNKKATTLLLVIPEKNEIIEKSFANLPGVTLVLARELSAQIAMKFSHILILSPEVSVETLVSKMS
jgi:large subunit ribosomal protein L4